MTLWGNGKLAVGTQGMPDSVIYGDNLLRGENDLFHLHLPCLPTNYLVDPSSGYDTSQLMSLKLSYGLITSPQLRFAQLGFDRGHQLAGFGNDEDLVLSTNSDVTDGPTGSGRGDIVITNRRIGRAIRFGTTYDSDAYPNADTDQERLTIAANGNVGIDLPKDSATGLMTPLDQVQIGGGIVPPSGSTFPTPGLTMYGGNPLENMPRPNGGLFPDDWRYLAFNGWVDHTDTSSSRFKRFQPMSSSRVAFAASNGGLLDLNCSPYDSTRGLNDFSHETTLELTGNGGLALWFMDTTANPYHHLFDICLPGQLPYGVTRNTSGLTFFHTPVCIGIDTPGHPLPDFTNLTGVYPDIGDGQTWDLVVNGPMLAKEIFVLDSSWADYVFNPGYKLMTIANFGKFMLREHHLPDIPDAKIMQKGVPVGRTEAAITKQMEEMALYIVQLSKQNESLTKEVKQLKADVEELKSRKEK